MTTMAPILRLARAHGFRFTRCSYCDAPAVAWYRTDIIADGYLLVAAQYCEQHNPDTHPGAAQTLGSLTVADVARLSPARARRAAARVARLAAVASAHRRASADLMGASSHTHTHALMSGYYEARASTLRELAQMAATTETKTKTGIRRA